MSARARTAARVFETVTVAGMLLKLKGGEREVESVLGAERSYSILLAAYCLLPNGPTSRTYNQRCVR